jgi:glycosyltransferase involved in cell wall biosynthesis
MDKIRYFILIGKEYMMNKVEDKTNQPEISIIVPVYNVEKYLEKCLKSILHQIFSDFELILIDDGSTDSSGRICDEYLKRDSRIKVFHKENGGLSSARNYGIEKSTGKYIGFVDSDDYIAKDMYEVLYNNLQRENADVSMCGNYDVWGASMLLKLRINSVRL